MIWNGRIHFKSDAALTVLGQLPSTRLLALLKGAPRLIRDPIYDLIARNRYRIFGRTETCMVPSPEIRARFLV